MNTRVPAATYAACSRAANDASGAAVAVQRGSHTVHVPASELPAPAPPVEPAAPPEPAASPAEPAAPPDPASVTGVPPDDAPPEFAPPPPSVAPPEPGAPSTTVSPLSGDDAGTF